VRPTGPPITSQEFCDGGTLLDALQRRVFFDDAAASPLAHLALPVLAQVARGCAYIHSKNIIHGQSWPIVV
jgi:serine/threonine protein kinase